MATLYVPEMAHRAGMTRAEYWQDCAARRRAEGDEAEARFCDRRAWEAGAPRPDWMVKAGKVRKARRVAP